jgi:hypothetical protein
MIITEIESRIQSLKKEMSQHLGSGAMPTTPEPIEKMEKSFHHQAVELADLMSASHIQKMLASDEIAEAVREFVSFQKGR